MSEKKAPEGAARQKREAPTIDLKAKDVTPSSAAEPTQAAADAAAAPQPESVRASESSPEMPTDAPPARDDSKPVAAAALPWTGYAAAGAAGGALAAAVFASLWYGDVLPVRTAAPADNSAQIAALQKQLQDLQSRPAPTIDTKAVDTLTQRVSAMDDVLKNVPKGDNTVGERLTAVENALKALGLTLTALTQRSDDAAANAAKAREQADAAEKVVAQLRGSVQDAAKNASSAVTPAQIEALTQRLAALEQTSKAASAEIDKANASEKATRLALGAGALRAAVTGGAPFAAELAQAKALGAPDKHVSVLLPFAATGVPTAAALTQELRAVLPQMVKAADATPSGSFIERLQANASKLVKVTPVDAPPGDDPAAVLARLDVAAARGDIAGALVDLTKLPELTRAPAQGWIAKAKAREAALTAANDLAAETARALGGR